MNVFVIIGSNRKQGETAKAVKHLLEEINPITQKIVFANELNIAPCTGCNVCRSKLQCSQQDDAQGLLQDMMNSDAVIIASPIYFGNLSGQLKVVLDRLYPAYRGGGKSELAGKPLYLIYTQHSESAQYADFRKSAEEALFKFMGFDLKQTTIVGSDGMKTEIAL